MKDFPILKTERLLLRQFDFTDTAELQFLANDREIAEGTYMPYPYEKEMAEDFIWRQAKDFEHGNVINFAITLCEKNELIGAIGLTFERETNEAQLGYWIGVSYWGKGYCTEAAEKVVNFGFEEFELTRIYAFHFSGNNASGKVLRKIGMNHDGTRCKEFEHMGKLKDIELYSLLNTNL